MAAPKRTKKDDGEFIPKPPDTIKIGKHRVFAYGIGTLPLGVAYPDPSKRPTKKEAINIIHTALDAGIQLFDTADTYCKGPKDLHYVETVLAEALDSHPKGKDAVVITKGGMARINETNRGWRPGSSSPAGVEKCIRASHESLGGKKPLAVWQVHHLDEVKDITASAAAAQALCDGNLVEAIGLCNTTVANAIKASRSADIVSIQNPYSLWERVAEKPLPPSPGKSCKKGTLQYCTDNNIPFLPYGFLGGIKSRDGRRDLLADYPELVEMAKDKGVSPQALALSYSRHLWPCILHIVGTRSAKHAADIASASEIRFTQKQFDKLHKGVTSRRRKK